MENTLDLHGVKHINVFRNVDQFIGHHVQRGTKEVVIITGYSQEMKKIVGEVLEDYGANSQEGWMNPGKLIIDLT
jgi:DNA-nicking Smr family endonuclease